MHKEGILLCQIVDAIGSPTSQVKKLDNIFAPLAGNTPFHVHNSAHCVECIHDTPLGEGAVVSCDVMSLFTRVLIDEPPGDCLSTSRGHHTSRQNLNRPRRSLHHHLTVSHNYLLLFQRYCLPADTGAAMGSPIFPIVANLYMEDSEKQALFSFPCKHRLWIRYVDDVFAVWLSKDHSLKEFHHHLNTQHPFMQFAVEKATEVYNKIGLLRCTSRKKGHLKYSMSVFWKKAHTDHY